MRRVRGWGEAADFVLLLLSLCDRRLLVGCRLHQGQASDKIRVHSYMNWFQQTPTATDVVGHRGKPDLLAYLEAKLAKKISVSCACHRTRVSSKRSLASAD